MYATDELRHEHVLILKLMEALEGATNRLIAGLEVPLYDLDAMVEAIKAFADSCHHGKEEELLFPAMHAAGMATHAGPIAIMLAEHEKGRVFVRGMSKALTEMQNNLTGKADFIQNATGYIVLLRNHILKENNILFQMAEQMLSEAEHTRLKVAFEEIEHERIGAGVHETITHQIHEWHDKYAESVVEAVL